jgi:hypothetical protein
MLQEISEGKSGSVHIPRPPLKEGSFKDHAPRAIDRDVLKD